ncbi:hypothetical protein SE17_38790, partial [Kouleothrix aurantiaca]
EVRTHAARARSLPALLDALENDVSRAIPTVLPLVAPVVAPGLVLMSLVGGWLERWLGKAPGAVFQLLRGLPNNVTTEMDLRLWALAQTIRADDAARTALLDLPVEEQAEAYAHGALPPVAQRGIAQFLQQYGMRGVAEIDIGRPRWRDDPTPLLQTLHGYLQLNDPALAPDAQFARGASEAAQLTNAWANELARTPFGALRARVLRFGIGRMRELLGLRESPKFYLIQTLGIYRDALLAHGRELVARGALDDAGDIFFLSLDELRAAARNRTPDLRGQVAANRAEYE